MQPNFKLIVFSLLVVAFLGLSSTARAAEPLKIVCSVLARGYHPNSTEPFQPLSPLIEHNDALSIEMQAFDIDLDAKTAKRENHTYDVHAYPEMIVLTKLPRKPDDCGRELVTLPRSASIT